MGRSGRPILGTVFLESVHRHPSTEESQPERANQYHSRVYASTRKRYRVHMRCTSSAYVLTRLPLTSPYICTQGGKNGRIEVAARVVVVPLVLHYVLMPIFHRGFLVDHADE